jgi:uncharacterized protein (TIGR01244 family)
MSRLAQLNESIWVAGQIQPADIGTIAAAGITAIINNRPAGEEYGQPTGAEIEAAALGAGLDYVHIPFHGLPPAPAIEAVRAKLAEADGATLLFCRSGTRSTWVWALARAREGDDPEAMIRTAAAAGYDLGSLRLYL